MKAAAKKAEVKKPMFNTKIIQIWNDKTAWVSKGVYIDATRINTNTILSSPLISRGQEWSGRAGRLFVSGASVVSV